MYKIELTTVEWERLVLAVGFAAGAASRGGASQLCDSFLDLYGVLLDRSKEPADAS